MKRLYYRALFFIFILFVASCSSHERIKGLYLQVQDPLIRQHYGGEMGALADDLKQAAVTLLISPVLENGMAFYPSDLLPQRRENGSQLLALRHELRRRNIRFAAYVPIFKDEYTQRSQPVSQAINDYGNGIRGWVCPSREEYQNYKLQIIKEIMLVLQPDVLYLSDCYYPAENIQNGRFLQNNHIRSSCFCAACQRDFSNYAEVEFPLNLSPADQAAFILHNYREEWALWRSTIITSFIEAAENQVRAINPACRLFLERNAWPQDYCNSGMRQLFAQDIKSLQQYVDIFVFKAFSETSSFNDSLLAAAIQESGELNRPAIVSFQVSNYTDNRKDLFRSDLQSYRHNYIVHDWGQLLNKRSYLNIFISEP